MSNTAKEIIKGAILMEYKGRAFYESVAQSTQNVSVREIFTSMAMEEAKHIQILRDRYEHLVKDGYIRDDSLPKQENDYAAVILSQKIRKEISGSGYEAAAITAALSMELAAVKYYSDRAQTAPDDGEKKLYQWLADWESSHVDLLTAIDHELKEKVWYDQQFWPVI